MSRSCCKVYWKTYLFAFVVIPLAILLVSTLFGSFLAGVEGWPFEDGFYFVANILTAATDPYITHQHPSMVGDAFIIIFSIWSQGFFFVVIALYGGAILIPAIKLRLVPTNGTPKQETFKSCRKLAIVVLVWPLVLSVCAALLAGPLAAAENWTFKESFLFLMAELAGVILPIVPVTPEGHFAMFFATLMGCFAISCLAFCFALVTGPICDPLVQWISVKDPTNWKSGLLRCIIFIFAFIPAWVFLLSTIFGGLIAVAEKWPYEDGFYYMANIMTVASNPFFDDKINEDPGIALVLMLTSWSYAMFVCVVALMSGKFVLPIAMKIRLVPSGEGDKARFKSALKKLLLLIFVCPAILSFIAVVFAGPLAAVEDWSFNEAFLFIAGQLAMLVDPMINIVPKESFGRFFAVLIGCWSLGSYALILVLCGGPIAEPLMSLLEVKVTDVEDPGESEPLAMLPLAAASNPELPSGKISVVAEEAKPLAQ